MSRQPYDNASNKAATHHARELRNNATPAERKLWAHLSNRQLRGIRFNRQVKIGPFICDFAARSAGLVIELDGGQHASAEREDARRTHLIEQAGYRVLRFWNNDVLNNVEGVLEVIAQALADQPSPDPSRKREGSMFTPPRP